MRDFYTSNEDDGDHIVQVSGMNCPRCQVEHANLVMHTMLCEDALFSM